jgi:iron complex transport system ATP-binding protein
MVILTFKNVCAGYGRYEILHNINFSMDKGEFVGIIGPNGSGKSTLLKTAAKILKTTSGNILLKNMDINKISLQKFAKTIAFLPSDIEITYPYTVKELLSMARYPFTGIVRNLSRKDLEIIAYVTEQMELNMFMERTIFQMSEGEKQRVMLAQCLVQEPEIILLDEPTAHLDIGFQFSFLDLLKRYQKNFSLSILAVLHDLNLASQYCNKLVLLDRGGVSISGTPENVLRYQILEKVYQTSVLVYPHPISGKPYVFGIPEEWKNLTEK